MWKSCWKSWVVLCHFHHLLSCFSFGLMVFHGKKRTEEKDVHQRRREGEGKYRNGDLWYNINYIYLVHSSRQVQWKKINVNFQDYRTNVLLGFENTSRMNTNAKSFLFGFFSKNVEWWPRFWKLDEAYSANSGATMNTTSSNFVESCWRIVVFT